MIVYNYDIACLHSTMSVLHRSLALIAISTVSQLPLYLMCIVCHGRRD